MFIFAAFKDKLYMNALKIHTDILLIRTFLMYLCKQFPKLHSNVVIYLKNQHHHDTKIPKLKNKKREAVTYFLTVV